LPPPRSERRTRADLAPRQTPQGEGGRGRPSGGGGKMGAMPAMAHPQEPPPRQSLTRPPSLTRHCWVENPTSSGRPQRFRQEGGQAPVVSVLYPVGCAQDTFSVSPSQWSTARAGDPKASKHAHRGIPLPPACLLASGLPALTMARLYIQPPLLGSTRCLPASWRGPSRPY
jgi:hypothetical protein